MTKKILDYKNLSADEKQELYLKVEKMIWSIVHQINGLSKYDKEDFFQDASLFFCEKVIPKFDPSKNVKFEYFVYTCIRNYLYRKINNLNKQNKRIFVCLPEMENNEDIFPNKVLQENYTEDNSCFDDLDKAELLKEMMYGDLEGLRENEKTVLKMIFENKNITHREISEKMGFSFASGVSAILSRLRKRIKKDNIFKEEC